MIITGLKRYTSEKGARDYREKYRRTLGRRISHGLEMRALARALRASGAGGKILDVPCGAGRLAPRLLRRGSHVTCADVSATMAREARDALAPLVGEGRVDLVRGSATALPFADRAFDAVVCWRLIHHLPEPETRRMLLLELGRVTRGPVVLSFSCFDTWKAKRREKSMARKGRRSHQTVMATAALRREAEAAGLDLVSVHPLSGWFSVVVGAVLRVRRA